MFAKKKHAATNHLRMTVIQISCKIHLIKSNLYKVFLHELQIFIFFFFKQPILYVFSIKFIQYIDGTNFYKFNFDKRASINHVMSGEERGGHGRSREEGRGLFFSKFFIRSN